MATKTKQHMSDDDILFEQFMQTFVGLTEEDILEWVNGIADSGTLMYVRLEPLFGKFETKCPRMLAKKMHKYASEKAKEK